MNVKMPTKVRRISRRLPLLGKDITVQRNFRNVVNRSMLGVS